MGRFISPDPLGDEGGDADLYGFRESLRWHMVLFVYLVIFMK
ncbi:hypothetical protein [Maridesulfovibrio sp. FT414]